MPHGVKFEPLPKRLNTLYRNSGLCVGALRPGGARLYLLVFACFVLCTALGCRIGRATKAGVHQTPASPRFTPLCLRPTRGVKRGERGGGETHGL
jgi:hypothetical protein